MKKLIVLAGIFIMISCIPTRIAPTIKDYKISVGKKFKKSLPNQYAFIFEDPKDADEFYTYINTKYQLKDKDVEYNVPIAMDNTNYYLSFYEVEIPNKSINLVPIAIDAKREKNGNDPILEDLHTSRTGYWYLALTVTDEALKDGLNPNYIKHQKILSFLKDLKKEYLTTQNYFDALLKN